MISNESLWVQFVATREPCLREKLVLLYVPLVRYVINNMSIALPRITDPEDIRGYGTVGLLHAVDRYDPARGVTFETYAIPRIRGAIVDALRNLNLLSRSQTEQIRMVERATEQMVRELQRYPTEDELAERLGISTGQVDHILANSNVSFVSLDAPLESDAGTETSVLKDILADPNGVEPSTHVERSELRAALVRAINELPEQSRLVVALLYVEELSPLEAAQVLRVSRSRVYQLHAKAILRLRARLRAEFGTSRVPVEARA